MNRNFLIGIPLATALLLLVPFVASRFSTEVKWSAADYLVAGTLLSGTGFTFAWLAGRFRTLRTRLAAALAVGGGLLLIWVNLAVGIIGSERNPANRMYLAVLAVGVLGAISGRFGPRAMARAMGATALAHASVSVITTVTGLAVGPELTKTLLVDACFIALWLGSAWLFHGSNETAAARTSAERTTKPT